MILIKYLTQNRTGQMTAAGLHRNLSTLRTRQFEELVALSEGQDPPLNEIAGMAGEVHILHYNSVRSRPNTAIKFHQVI